MMLRLTRSYLKHKTVLHYVVLKIKIQKKYYDRASNTLDGLPVVDLKSNEFKKAIYLLVTSTKCSMVFLTTCLTKFLKTVNYLLYKTKTVAL